MRWPVPLLLALLLPVTTGCVALPFASPPLQVGLGTGVRASLLPDERAAYDVPLQVRAGIHPLGLSPELTARRGDFALGYLADTGQSGTLHGAYLEASGTLLSGPLGDSWGRLSLRMQGRLHFDGHGGRPGQGAALQLTGEFSDFVAGPFDSTSPDGGTLGYAYGEGGIGFYVEAAYSRVDRTMGWTATTGLLFRVPASAGLAWAWAWTLL